jgi:hypothetical protein
MRFAPTGRRALSTLKRPRRLAAVGLVAGGVALGGVAWQADTAALVQGAQRTRPYAVSARPVALPTRSSRRSLASSLANPVLAPAA